MSLTDRAIQSLKTTGKVHKHFDGGGRYVHVSPTGGKLWRLAYRFGGKSKLLSFGAYPAVSLKMARENREEAKTLFAKGIDPGEHKKDVEKIAAHLRPTPLRLSPGNGIPNSETSGTTNTQRQFSPASRTIFSPLSAESQSSRLKPPTCLK